MAMRLPNLLNLKDLESKTPRVAPLPEDIDRPFWSVMIATYNTGDYLRRALGSVLSQDPGPDHMQIEVVDGCSVKDNPKQVVKEIGRGRVTFWRLSANQGAAHTFNTCIERARGRWVHILHGDDMVLPGFYEEYTRLARAYPQARMILGQSVLIDAEDRWCGVHGLRPPVGGGTIEDFTERQALEQLVLFPGVVVSRCAYEEVGGFCSAFKHVTDWDMWFRLGKSGPVACVSRPYAFYRIHNGSDTIAQQISGENNRECFQIITTNLSRSPELSDSERAKRWRSRLAEEATDTAWALAKINSAEGRYNQARWAWALKPTPARLVMLVKSWLKWVWAPRNHSLQRSSVDEQSRFVDDTGVNGVDDQRTGNIVPQST
jgi:GT2 family glycosyltransferase